MIDHATAKTARYYQDGKWYSGPDIFMNSWDDKDFDNNETALNKTGFASCLHYCVEDLIWLSPSIEVFQRPSPTLPGCSKEPPHYMVQLSWGNGFIETVYAMEVNDLMDLLAKWLPPLETAWRWDLKLEENAKRDKNR